MEKFISYVSNLVSQEKLEQLRNKLLVTPPEVVEQFNHFFTFEKDRPEIGYFVCVFESLIDPLSDRKPSKSKLKVKM